MEWIESRAKTKLTMTNQGGAFQFSESYQGPGLSNHTIIQRVTTINSVNRHNKYLYAIATTCLSLITCNPIYAETVGGVSATANPNSE